MLHEGQTILHKAFKKWRFVVLIKNDDVDNMQKVLLRRNITLLIMSL